MHLRKKETPHDQRGLAVTVDSGCSTMFVWKIRWCQMSYHVTSYHCSYTCMVSTLSYFFITYISSFFFFKPQIGHHSDGGHFLEMSCHSAIWWIEPGIQFDLYEEFKWFNNISTWSLDKNFYLSYNNYYRQKHVSRSKVRMITPKTDIRSYNSTSGHVPWHA